MAETTTAIIPEEFNRFKYAINVEMWENRDFDINREKISNTELRTFVLSRIWWYKEVGEVGDTLWDSFKEDFWGWNEHHFFRLGHDIYRFLNNFLRENGVNVAKDNRTISKRLVEVLQGETPPIWTLEQFQEQKFVKGGVSERFKPFFESVNVPIQGVTQHPNVQQRQDFQSDKQESIDSKIADEKLNIKQNNIPSNNVPQISIPTYNAKTRILEINSGQTGDTLDVVEMDAELDKAGILVMRE
ncbi:hypothetical protein OnM2_041063 [Erysiphe neolycopersici]|uniref:Uncharacterized protein n=1 Tax=Erysiphe neolycopersici TaxID=212602 RepID=A0A420HVR6_9PEZI|nr:hypothetical protein OnM2_041063 [Erysiphe neolycopersici]